ncbi:MAG TPA: bifunctional nuclease domain-containing protein [Prolixibacteraceae bacterium]
MKKIKLKILGLSYSQDQSGAYALVLAETDGNRRIPIIIGAVEAQAIAINLEGLKPPRPLTHDLFTTVLSTFDIQITEVFIHAFEEGIFYAEMKMTGEKGNFSIDSRTSDAIALALRSSCPIYTTEEVMGQTGIIIDFEDTEEKATIENTQGDHSIYDEFNLDELNEMLDKAIHDEEYEKASVIRDEITKRGDVSQNPPPE